MDIKSIMGNLTLKQEVISVPAWGEEEVTLQELSAAGMEAVQLAEGAELQMAATAVIHGVVDATTGKRIFKNADLAKIMEFPASVIVNVSTKIIGLTEIETDSEK